MSEEIVSKPDDFTQLCKVVTRFMQLQQYGSMRVLADGEPPVVGEELVSVDMPPWILHEEDFKAIRAMHRRIIDTIRNFDLPEDASDELNHNYFLILTGCSVASKIIVLIHCLLICYNYYNVPTEKYPGIKPSSLLDRNMTPDLFEGLEVLKWALINNPEKDAYLKANLLNDVYVVMKMFLDMLSGMLPCREVDDLRNAYMSFHSARDNGEAFRVLVLSFDALARRFAIAEPDWERKRGQSPYKEPMPLVGDIGSFKAVAELATAANRKKPPRGRIGSGLKGPKRTKMENQLQAFALWMKPKTVDENDKSRTIGAYAKSYWLLHKKSMDRAARGVGEKRGYKNAKCLADAYRNMIERGS